MSSSSSSSCPPDASLVADLIAPLFDVVCLRRDCTSLAMVDAFTEVVSGGLRLEGMIGLALGAIVHVSLVMLVGVPVPQRPSSLGGLLSILIFMLWMTILITQYLLSWLSLVLVVHSFFAVRESVGPCATPFTAASDFGGVIVDGSTGLVDVFASMTVTMQPVVLEHLLAIFVASFPIAISLKVLAAQRLSLPAGTMLDERLGSDEIDKQPLQRLGGAFLRVHVIGLHVAVDLGLVAFLGGGFIAGASTAHGTRAGQPCSKLALG